MPHWTEESIANFAYSLRSAFARQLDVESVPRDLPLNKAVLMSRERGKKVALVVYNDSDNLNESGPIQPEIFVECWNRCGQPTSYHELTSVLLAKDVDVLLSDPAVSNEQVIHGIEKLLDETYRRDEAATAGGSLSGGIPDTKTSDA